MVKDEEGGSGVISEGKDGRVRGGGGLVVLSVRGRIV